MNRLRSRGALAWLLCGSSLGILALLIAFPATLQEIKSAAHVAMPILWVAGILALTPLGAREGRGLASIAGSAYAVAFLLPAATVISDAGTGTEAIVWGFQAFSFGFLVVPFAWLANPMFLIAMQMWRLEWRMAAVSASVMAFVLALSAAIMLGTDIRVSVGFVAWAAAPAVLAVAVATRRRATEASRETAPA